MTKRHWILAALGLLTLGMAAISLLVLQPQPESADSALPTVMVLPSQTVAVATDDAPQVAQQAPAASATPAATADLIDTPTLVPAVASPTPELDTPAIPLETVPEQIVLQFDPAASETEREAYIQQLDASVIERIDVLDTVVVQVPPQTSIETLPPTDILQDSAADYFVVALQEDEPLYAQQWALPVIGAPAAWTQLGADAPQVTVAVIDSGICADHPDLAGRIVPGYDFVDDDDDPQDPLGHGCAVAGVIAANGDNGEGIAGVAPNASILPLRVLNAQGIGTYSDVAAALVYAADQGALIANLSLGGAFTSTVLEDAINYAVEQGVTVIAAAGNTGGDVLYPAAYAPVVAVASVDSNLERSSFSAFGPAIDLLAPGRDILTTRADGSYGLMSGTSFAAPHVAGVAALELALGRDLNLTGGLVQVAGTGDIVLPPTPEQSASPESPPSEQIVGPLPERGAQPAPNLGSDLAALYAAWLSGPQQAAETSQLYALEVEDGRVMVLLMMADTNSADAAVNALPGLGAIVLERYETLVDALVPVERLVEVANLPGVVLLRSPVPQTYSQDPPVPRDVSQQIGAMTTQGVLVSNADDWHAAGYQGQDVHIGVLDTFQFYDLAQDAGELPENIGTYGGLSLSNPHGTAVAEIIHDMAPYAELTFASPFSLANMANIITGMASDGMDIISSSITYCVSGPGDGTGVLSDAVNTAYDDGLLYVQSAGNYARSHWDGVFNDPSGDGVHEFAAGGVNLNYMTGLPGGYRINMYLRWNGWPTTQQDYDLYLLRWNGSNWNVVTSSIIDQTTSGAPPLEYINYIVPASGDYAVAIDLYSGDGSQVDLNLLNCGGNPFYYQVAARSLSDPATALRAFSVAALDVDSPYTLEIYSSRGPTYGPGSTLNGGLSKPRIAAFANVDTWAYGSGVFNGTSSAAPHVAGAAALVASANPSFSPAELMSFLENRAVDMGSAGLDPIYGYGRLHLGNIVAIVPELPVLIAPDDASFNTDGQPEFSWETAVDAVEYQIQVDDNSNFSSPEIDLTQTELSFTPGSPLPDARYYWRVRGISELGVVGPWSSRYVTVDTEAPAIPLLSSPANASITISTRPSFSWAASAGASGYEMQLDITDPPVAVASDSSSRSYRPPSDLLTRTYYWRVRAYDEAGNVSEWSDTFSLLVESAPRVAPISNRYNTHTPTLTWGRTSWATEYEIVVDNNSNFRSPEYSALVDGFTQEVTTDHLDNGTYYWRVRARRPDGRWGRWSSSEQFAVDVP